MDKGTSQRGEHIGEADPSPSRPSKSMNIDKTVSASSAIAKPNISNAPEISVSEGETAD